MSAKRDAYWCALPDSREVVAEFDSRREAYMRWLQNTGRLGRSLRALRAYYGAGPNGTADTSQLGVSGDKGQFTEMALPEYSGLMEQAFAQLVATKPGYQVVPKSGDYAARSQAAFGDKLLRAVEVDNYLEEKEDETTKAGLLCGESWLVLSWDKMAGETEGVSGERVVRSGDVRHDVALPWDVTFDVGASHKQNLQWLAFRRPINRWDAVASLKPGGEDMAAAEAGDPAAVQRVEDAWKRVEAVKSADPIAAELDDVARRMLHGEAESSDLVWMWELRHLKTPALPQGRLVQFISADCVLSDTAAEGAGYPYETLLAAYFEPSKVVGTAAGHSLSWDLLGLQEAIDWVATAMATAAHASAISNVWLPPGANASAHSLGQGLQLIESAVAPIPIHAIQVDPQAVAFLEMCRAYAQRRMGLNDVAMGDTTKGMPAQLAALMDAKVVQFWNQAVKSLSQMRARVRTGVLSLYRDFARTPRVTALVGKGEQFEMAEWTGDKLALTSRVAVDEVAATMKTLAGKMGTADLLLERGLINTPDEYLTVKATGRLEKLTEFKDRNLLRLQLEKEMLTRGIGLPPIDVLATEQALATDPSALPVFAAVQGEFIIPTVVDTPWLDIAEYAAVLASPEARKRPEVVRACTDMIQFKTQMWRSMPPEVIAALGGFPPPPSGEMMPQPGAMPDGEKPTPESDMRPIEPPKPPPNPLTGEQAPAPSDVTQPPAA